MLYMRVMYVEGAGCWLLGVGTSPGTWSLKMLSHGVDWGGAGWGVGHVGLVVADAALGVHPPCLGVSDKLSPQLMAGTQTRCPVAGGLSPSGVPRDAGSESTNTLEF